MSEINLNSQGRENFKKFLKESEFESIRDYATVVLYRIRNLQSKEEKKEFYDFFKQTLDETYGENVREDVFYIIAKIHKEETAIEHAIMVEKEEPETVSDEYERMCMLEDRYDLDERKALKNCKRHLSFYDGHIEDIADYDFSENENVEHTTTDLKKGTVYSVRSRIKRLK